MSTEYGVIIGRFQIDQLHKGHGALIEYVVNKHSCSKTIIFLGVREAVAGSSNPLSFLVRKEMIENLIRTSTTIFGTITILPLPDQPTDEMWVKKVDETIKNVIGFSASATIYHGRSSIGSHYTGRYPLEEFISGFEQISASDRRAQLKQIDHRTISSNSDFRAGIIHAYENLHFRTHETVDVALFDWNHDRLLVVQKAEDAPLWRLPGGFIDKGETIRFAAAREVLEETGMTVVDGADGIKIIDDYMIDDWRIRDEPNIQHRTILCYGLAEMIGSPNARDDVQAVRWLQLPSAPCSWSKEILTDFVANNIQSSHVPLVLSAFNNFQIHQRTTHQENL